MLESAQHIDWPYWHARRPNDTLVQAHLQLLLIQVVGSTWHHWKCQGRWYHSSFRLLNVAPTQKKHLYIFNITVISFFYLIHEIKKKNVFLFYLWRIKPFSTRATVTFRVLALLVCCCCCCCCCRCAAAVIVFLAYCPLAPPSLPHLTPPRTLLLGISLSFLSWIAWWINWFYSR